jgi:hypothetical protein
MRGKTPTTDDGSSPLERAEHHAKEAERLLKSWWISSHVEAQVHATLAVYYSAQAREGQDSIPVG